MHTTSGRAVAFSILLALVTGAAVTLTPAPSPAADPPKPAATRPAADADDEVFPAGDAESVVYVLTADGSLMTSFDSLRQVVRDAVGRLRPAQRFNVVLVQGEDGRALADNPIPATPQNVERLNDFLAKTAPHNGELVGALRTAFAQHPRRLFLLENGDAPNNAEVTRELRKLNAKLKPAERVQVHTVGWMEHDQGYETWLKGLAAEHGGTYRFVDEAFLERAAKAKPRAAATTRAGGK